MKPIIEVQGLSKKYQITANNPRYLSLRDSMTDFFKFKKRSEKEDFWALKDIDFKGKIENIGTVVWSSPFAFGHLCF